MLKKKERLMRDEFNRFFALGKRYNSSALQLIYHPHDALHASVVVSKKVCRQAVKRNKLRRRIYDIIRSQKATVGLTGVFIVVTRPPAAALSYEALREEVLELIGRTQKSR